MKNKAASATIGIPFLMTALILLKVLKLIDLSWFWVIVLPIAIPIGITIVIFSLFFLFLLIVALFGGNTWR